MIKELSDRDLLLKYKIFFKYLIRHQIFNSKNSTLFKENKRTSFAKKYLLHLTDILPRSTKIPFRLKLLRYKILPSNYFCPICGDLKSFSKSKGKFYWPTICFKKNEYHIKIRKSLALILSKKTCMSKYGVTNPMKLDSIKQKNLESHRKKYGSHFFKSSSFKKLNLENPMHNRLVVKKQMDTNMLRYGVPNVFMSTQVKSKIKETNLRLFKANTSAEAHIKNKAQLTPNFLITNFLDKSQHIKMIEAKKYYNITESTVYKYFNKFNINFIKNYGGGGFNPDKEATLYYIKDKDTNLYKIGITNNSLYDRFGKAFLESRAEILMEQSYENGQDAYLAEQEILQAFAKSRCNNDAWPEAKGGKTEFFNRNILEL